MKRVLTIIAAAAVAMFVSGCKIDEGGDFNPTALGYELSSRAASLLCRSIEDVNTLRMFDKYLSADADERVKIQDRYFYSVRIVERENDEWHLIDGDNELVILTGGALLSTAGTKWSYYYYDSTYDNGEFPSLTNISGADEEKYALKSVRTHAWHSAPASLDLTMAFNPYDRTTDGTTEEYAEIYIDTAGDQTIVSDYGRNANDRFTFRTLSTLRFDTGRELFYDGRISVSIEIDGETLSPEAQFSDTCITVYGGKNNAYSRAYPYSFYYYYY